MERKIGDLILWESISGLKSGKILDIRYSIHGTEYKVSRPDNKCVWINEKSIREL